MNITLQDLSPVTVPLALDANLIAYSALFSSLPQAELHDDGGLLWFENGEPVATVALFFEAGVASINWMVSLPQFRRQGIGVAMTLMAAREARSAGYRA